MVRFSIVSLRPGADGGLAARGRCRGQGRGRGRVRGSTTTDHLITLLVSAACSGATRTCCGLSSVVVSQDIPFSAGVTLLRQHQHRRRQRASPTPGASPWSLIRCPALARTSLS